MINSTPFVECMIGNFCLFAMDVKRLDDIYRLYFDEIIAKSRLIFCYESAKMALKFL